MEKVVIEYTRSDIKEVRAVWDEDEANELLHTGKWLIMHAGVAHADGLGFQAKPVYIMARTEQV